MQPHQIISLMTLGGPSFAMADHDDHIHVGYYPKGQSPQAEQAVLRAPEARPVEAADRAHRPDRQPDGPDLAVALLDPDRQGQAEVQPVKRRSLRRLAWPAPR